MIEIVDLLDARTIQRLFEFQSTLPKDTVAHGRRRLQHKKEVLDSLPPVVGRLAGDPQTGGVVFIRAS